ncbi:MAG: alpha/beta fold hydrolase [Geminicoccaceae bacterium]
MKLRVSGYELNLVVDGSPKAPPLLLLHALATNGHMFDDAIAELARHFRCIRVDLRGHGLSEAPPRPYAFKAYVADLLGVLDHLGIARTHVLGVSLGGMIAQHLGLIAPERIERLVLVSTTSRTPLEARPVWQERMDTVSAHGVASQIEPTLARWFTDGYAKTAPNVFAQIGEMIGKTSQTGYLGACDAIMELDVTGQLKGLRGPTLVMVGEQDQGTPVSAAQAIQAAVPDARLVVVPDASHMLPIEQREAFLNHTLAFLRA